MISPTVAAGHPATASAGAEILAAGGSAADAAVAAALVSCVAETLMTGLLGGGYAIHFDSASRTVRNLDCFVSVPSGSGAPDGLAPHPVRRRVRGLLGRRVVVRGSGPARRPRRALERLRPTPVVGGRRAGAAPRAHRSRHDEGARLVPRDAHVGDDDAGRSGGCTRREASCSAQAISSTNRGSCRLWN